MSKPLLEMTDVTIQIAGRSLCGPLSLSLMPGDRLGILGQNGTGKTTLLHTLMRLHPVHLGQIQLLGRPLSDWPANAMARQCGILFQREPDQMPASVYETVLLGRFPHQHAWQWESEEDHSIVRQSLTAMELEAFAERDIATLSGGERQRVAIAALLAQQPKLFLLDEPSNHLDVAFQIKVLDCLRQLSAQQESTVVIATHDINLASRLCNRILLLQPTGKHHFGDVDEVLQEALLSEAFQCRIRSISSEDGMLYYPQTNTGGRQQR
jgi:iron complex transport system ATP-binding protein